MSTDASKSHSRTQPAHHHWRTKQPRHIQTTVRPGDSVSIVIASRLFFAACAGLERSAKALRGRNTAVNARRLQCTPTRDVYRAYGKNVFGFGGPGSRLGVGGAWLTFCFLPDATRDVVPAMFVVVVNNVGGELDVSGVDLIAAER